MEQFKEEIAKKGWPCKLISKHSKKVLSVSQDPETQGVLVLQHQAQRPEQRFRLLRKENKYVLATESSYDCVSVLGGKKEDGVLAVTLPFCDVDSQYLQMDKQNKKQESCSLLTFCGKALECYGEDTAAGTCIVQWTNADHDHQKWYVNFL